MCYHEELRQTIEAWRPYLIGDDTSVDTLKLHSFHFDFSKVIATSIYIDLGRLLHAHALKDDNMSKEVAVRLLLPSETIYIARCRINDYMVILFIETIKFNALNIFELCINFLIYQFPLKDSFFCITCWLIG